MSWEGLNRRKFPRATFPCLIKFATDHSGQGMLLTHTENISTGGMCVIIKRQMERFSLVDMEIDLMDGEDTIRLQGKVVWVVRRKATEEEKPSFYDTGVEFIGWKEKDRARVEVVINKIVAVKDSASIL